MRNRYHYWTECPLCGSTEKYPGKRLPLRDIPTYDPKGRFDRADAERLYARLAEEHYGNARYTRPVHPAYICWDMIWRWGHQLEPGSPVEQLRELYLAEHSTTTRHFLRVAIFYNCNSCLADVNPDDISNGNFTSRYSEEEDPYTVLLFHRKCPRPAEILNNAVQINELAKVNFYNYTAREVGSELGTFAVEASKGIAKAAGDAVIAGLEYGLDYFTPEQKQARQKARQKRLDAENERRRLQRERKKKARVERRVARRTAIREAPLAVKLAIGIPTALIATAIFYQNYFYEPTAAPSDEATGPPPQVDVPMRFDIEGYIGAKQVASVEMPDGLGRTRKVPALLRYDSGTSRICTSLAPWMLDSETRYMVSINLAAKTVEGRPTPSQYIQAAQSSLVARMQEHVNGTALPFRTITGWWRREYSVSLSMYCDRVETFEAFTESVSRS